MYNVQCLVGHVQEAPHGSDLERRCIEREKQGYLDALCLSYDECPDCREDRREYLRREVRRCGDVGCPMGEDKCKNGCLMLHELRTIPA